MHKIPLAAAFLFCYMEDSLQGGNMNDETLYMRYGKYKKIIELLGRQPFNRPLIIERLIVKGKKEEAAGMISRADVQAAYRDMGKDNYPWGIMEYLLWVSSKMLVHRVKEDLEKAQAQGQLGKETPTILFEYFLAKDIGEAKNFFRLLRSDQSIIEDIKHLLLQFPLAIEGYQTLFQRLPLIDFGLLMYERETFSDAEQAEFFLSEKLLEAMKKHSEECLESGNVAS